MTTNKNVGRSHAPRETATNCGFVESIWRKSRISNTRKKP